MTQTATAAAARPVLTAPIRRGGMGVSAFYVTHLMGGVFPLTAGLMLYGIRAAVAVATVVASAAVATLVWRRIGPRGRTLNYAHTLWLALLLGLMMPAHLAVLGGGVAERSWAILVSAGILLVIFLWLSGGLGGGHVHPVLVTYLLLVICFADLLVPHRILARDHLLTGDLFRTNMADARSARTEPWLARRPNRADADFQEPAAERLTRYTSGREAPARRWLPLQGLLRDAMPPLEDFVLAGQPGAIGTSSALAAIIGGLFLLYRGLIDYRIPLLTGAAAFVMLLVLPVPVLIDANGPQWHWAVFRMPTIGWSVALTFVNYEIMASPLIFMAFFLATAPVIRPMTRRGRTLYALTLGACTAALQLYVSVSYAPYVALLGVSLLTPALDRVFSVKPIV